MKSCVVGLGAISQKHIQPILEAGQLTLVCDIDKEKADNAAEKYGCRACYSFDEVLEDENVQCVHICTPHYLHFEMAKKAALKGKNIVLEKPAVMNFSEYEELKEVLDKTKVKCVIMLQNRYNPCMQYILKNKDKYKNIMGLKGILTWKRTMEYYSSGDWRGKWATEGGGFLINQAPHMIDLLCLFGGKLKDACGTYHTRYLDIEVEDTAEATLYFENGVRAFFFGTNAYCENSSYEMEFVFEEKRLRYFGGKLFEIENDKITLVAEDLKEDGEKFYWGLGHDILIKRFYEGKDYPHFEDYLPTLKVLEKIYKRG